MENIYTSLLDGYKPVAPVVSPNISTEINVGFALYQVESLVLYYDWGIFTN